MSKQSELEQRLADLLAREPGECAAMLVSRTTTRHELVQGAGRRGGPVAIALLELLRDLDPSQNVRNAAMGALFVLQDEGRGEKLQPKLMRAKMPKGAVVASGVRQVSMRGKDE